MKIGIILICALLISFQVHAASAGRRFVFDVTSIANLAIANTFTPDNGSLYNVDQQKFAITIGYNFAEFELGPVYSYVNTNDQNETVTSNEYGGYFKYNFTPNIAKNNFIPFAKATFSNTSNKKFVAGTETTEFQMKIGGGVTFFPVNDFVGLDASLLYRDGKASGDLPGKRKGFLIGTAINLYF